MSTTTRWCAWEDHTPYDPPPLPPQRRGASWGAVRILSPLLRRPPSGAVGEDAAAEMLITTSLMVAIRRKQTEVPWPPMSRVAHRRVMQSWKVRRGAMQMRCVKWVWNFNCLRDTMESAMRCRHVISKWFPCEQFPCEVRCGERKCHGC